MVKKDKFQLLFESRVLNENSTEELVGRIKKEISALEDRGDDYWGTKENINKKIDDFLLSNQK